MNLKIDEKEFVFNLFRNSGYLAAKLDPLGFLKIESPEELNITGQLADLARKYYCGSIGAEFMHIHNPERRLWIQNKLEEDFVLNGTDRILKLIVSAEVFEQVLQTRYVGTKRFSLEGLISLIPLLDTIISESIQNGIKEIVFGMSHRGRLNVMVNIIGVSPVDVFTKFEDVDPQSVLGSGDVKYHIGATGHYELNSGMTAQVRLVSNPSHLEAVDPVALGRVKAKQDRFGKNGIKKIMPILIHGDAAFAGQGITAETLNLSTIDGYSVGGTIHIIGNNLIGFTANPVELHSSIFASDIAKRLPIPILHVNAEDLDAVIHAAKIAAEYRHKFSSVVIIDLIGYRKHGHSEVDDPTITHPLLYSKINKYPPLSEIFAKKNGANISALLEDYRRLYNEAHDSATGITKNPVISTLPEYWKGFIGGVYSREYETNTSITSDRIIFLTGILTRVPGKFSLHPKIKRFLEQRNKMGAGELPVDFGMAEALAFGSLLQHGISIRMSGQDSKRGTFAQRNISLIDIQNENEYFPLKTLEAENIRFEIYNSPLSEASVMGFEYGYSREYPDALVIWEAQFGDFQNGAQIILDEFISSAEDKWGLLSGLVLLLPHGYEGQGPDHSSARLERFLQSASEFNYQVCQPSNAAQYFHLLRRQALRKWQKPLIVFTPKSLLRYSGAGSSINKFTDSEFKPILSESIITNAERIIICSGKIYHELRRKIIELKISKIALISIEQFYPFPEEEIIQALKHFSVNSELVWVQEEPANMGALSYIIPKLELISGGRQIRSIKRSASASPATGSQKAHEQEQKILFELSLT